MTDLKLTTVVGGVLLGLRVSAGSSRAGLMCFHGDRLKVAVREPPERGKANRAIVGMLAGALGIRKRDVEISSGAGSALKTVLVRGMDADNLRRRLEDAVSED